MPTWLGIDIGSASVKVALVRSDVPQGRARAHGLGRRVGRAAAWPRPRASRSRRRWRASPRGPTRWPRRSTARARRFTGSLLPATAQKQLADVLAVRARGPGAVRLESAVFDWRSARARREDGQLSIVAAVARDRGRARAHRAREGGQRAGAGARRRRRVPAGRARARSFRRSRRRDASRSSTSGAKASEVLVLERGEAVFARTLSRGTEGLPATAPGLARELRVSLAAHRAQGGAAPERVFLCGGGAFVSGAEGFLSGALEVPVQLLPAPTLEIDAAGGSRPGAAALREGHRAGPRARGTRDRAEPAPRSARVRARLRAGCASASRCSPGSRRSSS